MRLLGTLIGVFIILTGGSVALAQHGGHHSGGGSDMGSGDMMSSCSMTSDDMECCSSDEEMPSDCCEMEEGDCREGGTMKGECTMMEEHMREHHGGSGGMGGGMMGGDMGGMHDMKMKCCCKSKDKGPANRASYRMARVPTLE